MQQISRNWTERESAKSQQGAVSSVIEGGINAGLNEQEHGHNMEMLESYFDQMTDAQKELMKEQFGLDVEKMREQLSNSKELSSHESELAKEQSSHEAELEAQKEQRNLRAQGVIVSGGAGLSSPNLRNTVTSGIRHTDGA